MRAHNVSGPCAARVSGCAGGGRGGVRADLPLLILCGRVGAEEGRRGRTGEGVSALYPFFTLGGVKLYAYGLMISLGLACAAGLACLRVHRRGGDLVRLAVLIAAVNAAGVVGAKLGYLVTAYPGGFPALGRDIRSIGFLRVIVERSGLVFYGGMILGLVTGALALRLMRLDFRLYSEAVVPVIPLGHAIGRIGCLMAGCCHGIPWDGALAVHYRVIPGWVGNPPAGSYFPVQPLESLLNLFLFLALTLYTKRERPKYAVVAVYLLGYAAIRFGVEFLRGDPERGIHGPLSSSQWISLFAALAGAGLVLIIRRRRRREG